MFRKILGLNNRYGSSNCARFRREIGMQNLQSEFESLVKNPNKPTTGDSLKRVALAVWYENFVPEVNALNGHDASQAGYLLDRLTRYYCLEKSQKNYLRTQLLPNLKNRRLTLSGNVSDQLAKEWGASFELKQEFRELLPYQRRSYKHNHPHPNSERELGNTLNVLKSKM